MASAVVTVLVIGLLLAENPSTTPATHTLVKSQPEKTTQAKPNYKTAYLPGVAISYREIGTYEKYYPDENIGAVVIPEIVGNVTIESGCKLIVLTTGREEVINSTAKGVLLGETFGNGSTYYSYAIWISDCDGKKTLKILKLDAHLLRIDFGEHVIYGIPFDVYGYIDHISYYNGTFYGLLKMRTSEFHWQPARTHYKASDFPDKVNVTLTKKDWEWKTLNVDNWVVVDVWLWYETGVIPVKLNALIDPNTTRAGTSR